jgi:hypothetical protein
MNDRKSWWKKMNDFAFPKLWKSYFIIFLKSNNNKYNKYFPFIHFGKGKSYFKS